MCESDGSQKHKKEKHGNAEQANSKRAKEIKNRVLSNNIRMHRNIYIQGLRALTHMI